MNNFYSKATYAPKDIKLFNVATFGGNNTL